MSQSEFAIIERYFSQAGLAFSKPGIDLGIGDDCALLSVPSGQQLALSMDILHQDVHFPANAEPNDIARRALAVNLSDLAAMGAEPLGFTLGLSLPAVDEHWLDKFSQGLLSSAQDYSCPLIGGDLSQGPLSIVIQVHGLVAQDQAIRRSGAVPGDLIFVTGNLGDAAIALLLMQLDSHISQSVQLNTNQLTAAHRNHFLDAYFDPVPKLEFARSVCRLINSGIDISDGLVGDIGHILKASGVNGRINTASLPLSSAMKQCVNADGQIAAALTGGDDYQLCVTLAADNSEEFRRIANELKVRVNCIGEITALSQSLNDQDSENQGQDSEVSEQLKIFDAAGRQLQNITRPYTHFIKESS